MAKPYKIPDFRKMYPEASEKVIAVLRTSERKMQYQEYDLKSEQTIIDQENQTVTIIPSREDSFERLVEQSVQFREETLSLDEWIIRRLEIEQLHKALNVLSDDERYLIIQLYFEERTEREVAEELGVYHNAVHKNFRKDLISGCAKCFFNVEVIERTKNPLLCSLKNTAGRLSYPEAQIR